MKILFSFLLGLSLFGAETRFSTTGTGSVLNHQQPVVTSGLMGHWTLDGPKVAWGSATAFTATDDSGNSNTGTSAGTHVQRTAPIGGARGQGLSFLTGRVDCGSGATLDNLELQGGNGMSVCFWLKPSPIATGTIIAKGIDSNNGRWQILSSTTSARLSFNKDAATTDGNAVFDNSNEAGSWNFYVFTWDGTSDFNALAVKLWKNGTAVGLTTGTDSVGAFTSDASNPLSFGGTAASQNYVGGLDDIRVYNRVLSQAEVATIYTSGIAIFGSVGHTPITQTVDYYIDFEGGSNGVIPTAATLGTSSHGSGLTWTVNPDPLLNMTFAASAEAHLLDSLIVGGITYTDASGNLGLLYSYDSVVDLETSVGTLTADTDSLSAAGFVKSNIPITSSVNFSFFALSSADSMETLALQLKPSTGFLIHATFGGSSESAAIAYSPNTLYWWTIKWIRNGAGTLKIYAGYNLMGTVTLPGNLADKQVHFVLVESDPHGGSGAGWFISIDDIALDFDGSLFPILP